MGEVEDLVALQEDFDCSDSIQGPKYLKYFVRKIKTGTNKPLPFNHVEPWFWSRVINLN